MTTPLPAGAARLAEQFPDIWSRYQALGEACSTAGPLDAKTRRLVKLALALGAGAEGAVHSHVRRAQAEQIGNDELRHVALLAITTLGFPAAAAGLSWISDLLEQ
jgi:alkylhydroperoxidase/carboxymuconolactone decarboxylase family protein YurZ